MAATTIGTGSSVRATRRQLLRVATAGGLWLTLAAHSPYRQWEVHRKTRLVLLVSASDRQSVRLGASLTAIYLKTLPASRATMARARDNNDLVRLLASRQLDVALLHERDAHAAFAGEPPYAGSALPLRVLAAIGPHVFVCREDLPDASAYMLVEALAGSWQDLEPALVHEARDPRPATTLKIPLHPGALDYYRDH